MKLLGNEEDSYQSTKEAQNLSAVILKDPYQIMLKKFGERYANYRRAWRETGQRLYARDFPLQVDVELADCCNLNCKYCYQRDFPGWTGEKMSKEVFIKILDEMERREIPALNIGWNAEPLVYTDQFLQFLEILKAYDIMDVFVHTNSLRLTKDIQEAVIDSNITTMCLSLATLNDDTREKRLQKIKENMVNFKKLRDEKNKEFPIIRVGIIPSNENMEILPETVEFWSEYADYVEFQNLCLLYPEMGKGYDRQPWRCNNAWRRISITAQGDIFGCCTFTYFTEGLKLGDINDITIREGWNCQKMRNLRQSLILGRPYPKCKECQSAFYLPKNFSLKEYERFVSIQL